MAFEKVEQFGARISQEELSIHIRMNGALYLGGALVSNYPITNEYRTANIYIDVEKSLIAILPLKELMGIFRISRSGSSSHISCSRFLDTYNVTRNQKCLCKIEDVDGEKMIVFRVEFNKAKDDE